MIRPLRLSGGDGHGRSVKSIVRLRRPELRHRSQLPGWVFVLLVFVSAIVGSGSSWGQTRFDREGLTLYWGLVPEAILAERHDIDQLHGGRPKGGGQVHHLMVALFDSTNGRRIENALVRAQLSETGFVDAPAKYLPPMAVNGKRTYGQLFAVAKEGPYQLRVFVKLPDRPREIEYAMSTSSPHGQRP